MIYNIIKYIKEDIEKKHPNINTTDYTFAYKFLEDSKNQAYIEDTINKYIKNFSEHDLNLFKKHFLRENDELLDNLNLSNIRSIVSEHYKTDNQCYPTKLKNEEYYYYFNIIRTSYSYICKQEIKEQIFNNYNSKIIDLHGDIYNNDSNFKDNQLLPLYLNKNLILDTEKNLIRDQDDNVFQINHMGTNILRCIKELQDQKIINKISFKITDINSNEQIEKTLEKGSLLHYNIDKIDLINMLYDPKIYDDKLMIWHTKDDSKSQFIFEEILEDFDNDDSENIITQIVHLTYIGENNNYYIDHIDHEYIFYSIEQYDKKLESLKKGKENIKGHKKIKTFKIDEAKIPFFYKDANDIFFLYLILENFFTKKELLKEYFNKVN